MDRGWSRGRKGRTPTDPNKTEVTASTVKHNVSQLLVKYFAPVMKQYPLGQVEQSGVGMYRTMRAASERFCRIQDFMNGIYDEDRNVAEAHSTLAKPSNICTTVVLPETIAEDVQRNQYDGTWSGVIFHLPNRVRVGKHGDFLKLYLPVLEDINAVDLTEAGIPPADYQRAMAAFTFSAPFATPEGVRFFMQHTTQSSSLSGENTRYVGADSSMWILPSHPDFAAWERWGKVMYMMETEYKLFTDHVDWLLQCCPTVGQLRRMWPSAHLYVNEGARQQLTASKAASPYPDIWDRMPPRFQALVKARTAKLDEMLARCTMLPNGSPDEMGIVDSIDTTLCFVPAEGCYQKAVKFWSNER